MDLPQFKLHEELEETHWWFTARRQLVLNILKHLLKDVSDPFIVDIGCGTGANTAAINTRYKCIGIDPIAKAIESARSRFPNTEFREGYAPNDMPEIEQADAVLLLDVLEHVEQDQEFVISLINTMKPGAILLMAAPADPKLWSVHDRGFGHFRRYTERSFHQLWRNTDSETLLISHWNTHLYPVIRAMRTLGNLIGTSSGKADTDLSMPPAPVNKLLQYLLLRENAQVLRALRHQGKPYSYGVSLFGVIQKN